MNEYCYWCAQCGAIEHTTTSERPQHCGQTMKAHGRQDSRELIPHPLQPVGLDGNDVIRFKPNAIVRYLLDHGPFNLNDLAELSFSVEDWEQFAQLLGYSVGGFSDLHYVRDETLRMVEARHSELLAAMKDAERERG